MNDGYFLDTATGAMTLTFNTKSYVLAAPDFGRWRDFSVLNEKRIEDELGMLAEMTIDTLPDEPEVEDGTPADAEASAERVRQRMADSLEQVRENNRQRDIVLVKRFGFWREAAQLWGVTFPEDDDRLPPWLGNAELIDQAVEHWVNFPFRVRGDSAAVS